MSILGRLDISGPHISYVHLLLCELFGTDTDMFPNMMVISPRMSTDRADKLVPIHTVFSYLVLVKKSFPFEDQSAFHTHVCLFYVFLSTMVFQMLLDSESLAVVHK